MFIIQYLEKRQFAFVAILVSHFLPFLKDYWKKNVSKLFGNHYRKLAISRDWKRGHKYHSYQGYYKMGWGSLLSGVCQGTFSSNLGILCLLFGRFPGTSGSKGGAKGKGIVEWSIHWHCYKHDHNTPLADTF